MRPQATDFAASAKQRESVLSLGSISHLQHYFARTGLLDGKGAQLARKRQQKGQTLDFASLDGSSFLTPQIAGSDVDSSYASMGSSPDLGAQAFTGQGITPEAIVESPVDENPEEDYYLDEYDESDPNILPPTTSTYQIRDKPLPKPPTIQDLKHELTSTLDDAAKGLEDASAAQVTAVSTDGDQVALVAADQEVSAVSPGWYEIQGMHILDVMTLAIRAAKVYYTSHEQPDRLDAIKSEKEVRSELLAVMDVLKRMAARGFAGGLKQEETSAMNGWIDSVRTLLRKEEEMEAAEQAERASWTWLPDEGWSGKETEREYAFLQWLLRASTQAISDSAGLAADHGLPEWTPIDRSVPADPQLLPTPFLKTLQTGLLLVQLHNTAVRRSKRRFGAIPTFHTDTQKPYRSADNLRYWTKAAELRWEVDLRIDALGIVYNTASQVWVDFEDAIRKWCKRVREEITLELQV
jgi:hypothetical protein